MLFKLADKTSKQGKITLQAFMAETISFMVAWMNHKKLLIKSVGLTFNAKTPDGKVLKWRADSIIKWWWSSHKVVKIL